MIAPVRHLPTSLRGWDLALAAALALVAGPGRLVDEAAHRHLALHMTVQHWLLVGAGALGSHGLGLAVERRWRARSLFGAALLVLLLWHVPTAFGWGIGDGVRHGVMHLSVLASGAAVAAAWRGTPAFERLVLLLAVASVLSTVALMMIAGAVVYPGYPPGQTRTAGVAMVVGMPVAAAAALVAAAIRRAPRSAARAALLAALLAVFVVGLLR